MANSISSLRESAESCNIEVWQSYGEAATKEKLARIQFLRDPLKNCSFRTEQIKAVYGYYSNEGSTSLVYFWEANQHALRWQVLEHIEETRNYLNFGIFLGSVHQKNPTLKKATLYLQEEIDKNMPDLNEAFRGLNLYWANFGDLKFSCIYLDSRSDKKVEHVSSLSLLECLSFHFDYFCLRSIVWDVVPMRFLFAKFGGDLKFFERVLLHPKCFNPLEPSPADAFLWPWQRCLTRGRYEYSVDYSSVTTTSLVFDLRKSTIALEQVRKERIGEYSRFINRVIESAKEIVFSFGGFFDKETGDGIVCHFIEFTDNDQTFSVESPNRRAFEAAVQIVRMTSRICEEFQRQLKLGVGELGAAVGLHTGDAVWVAERRQVRAIGEGVILAARLCREAPARSVFVSNLLFLELSNSLSAELVSSFFRREYTGKEIKNGAGLFGYLLKVADNF